MTNTMTDKNAYLAYENALYASGYKYIAGVDEAGRGPLAGPVVSAAVILPQDTSFLEIKDSKQVSAKKRDALFDEIKKYAIAYSIVVADVDIIDSVNILQATLLSMEQSIQLLKITPEYVLTDFETLSIPYPQWNLIKGDQKSKSIAAASILAKVTRDKVMEYLDGFFPMYEFERHKGYPTKIHRELLIENGPCAIHRKLYVKKYKK